VLVTPSFLCRKLGTRRTTKYKYEFRSVSRDR
jgi:hypothetical protein